MDPADAARYTPVHLAVLNGEGRGIDSMAVPAATEAAMRALAAAGEAPFRLAADVLTCAGLPVTLSEDYVTRWYVAGVLNEVTHIG